MTGIRGTALAGLFAVSLHIAPALAYEPVLAVGGATGTGTAYTLSRVDLTAMGTATIATATPWHDGVVVFEGVPMKTLLEAVGARGEILFVEALNNYSSELPIADFDRHEPILAMKADGKYMGIADKGPFFIVYPYDASPELKSELYYSRSVWQVRSITVE